MTQLWSGLGIFGKGVIALIVGILAIPFSIASFVILFITGAMVVVLFAFIVVPLTLISVIVVTLIELGRSFINFGRILMVDRYE